MGARTVDCDEAGLCVALPFERTRCPHALAKLRWVAHVADRTVRCVRCGQAFLLSLPPPLETPRWAP